MNELDPDWCSVCGYWLFGDEARAKSAAAHAAQKEIELLRAAVKTLGSNCDHECGQPEGTFASQQFMAIDKAVGRP